MVMLNSSLFSFVICDLIFSNKFFNAFFFFFDPTSLLFCFWFGSFLVFNNLFLQIKHTYCDFAANMTLLHNHFLKRAWWWHRLEKSWFWLPMALTYCFPYHCFGMLETCSVDNTMKNMVKSLHYKERLWSWVKGGKKCESSIKQFKNTPIVILN